MSKKILVIISVIVILASSLCACDTASTDISTLTDDHRVPLVQIVSPISPPALSAQSAVLIDATSNTILCEKDAHVRMGMASTTKIMTALVAAENCELEKEITVSPLAVGVEGSSVYLYAGEKLTMKDLICAMLLESANDAAAAIAIDIGGSIEGFCDMMNKKADELGLSDTHFTNPHGLYDDEHYTTAYELAVIASEALRHPVLKSIFSTRKVTISPIEGNARVLYNHNKMLSLYEGAIGVKTGFTKKTGRTLVSAAQRDGLCLVAVTLNASDDWNDHAKLLDLGFCNFYSATLIEKGEVCHMLPIMGAADQYTALVSETEVLITLPLHLKCEEISRVVETYNRYEFAPLAEGKVAGKISYYINGRLIASTRLVTASQTSKLAADNNNKFFDKLKDVFT